jgi:hypothetical protein
VRSCNTAMVQMGRSVQNVYCYLRCTFLYFLTSVRFFCRLRGRSWSNRRFFSGILHYDLQNLTSIIWAMFSVLWISSLTPCCVCVCVCVCVCSTKKSSKGKAPGKAGTRFWKNVGLGFKTPREAIEGEVCAILLKQWFLVGGLCWLHKAARV